MIVQSKSRVTSHNTSAHSGGIRGNHIEVRVFSDFHGFADRSVERYVLVR